MKRRLLLLCLMLSLGLTGCFSIDTERLIDRDEPTAVPSLPTVHPLGTPKPDPNGYSLRLTTAGGTVLILQESSLARILLDAAAEERLRLDNPGCAFPHTLEVLDASGAILRSFSLADDGCLNAKDEAGNYFRVPEYLWSEMETELWKHLDSLWVQDWIWSGDTESTAALEVRLPYLLTQILPQRVGCLDGYFCTYKLYEVAVGKDTVRIYLLAVWSAYSIQNDRFHCVYEEGVPVRLTLDRVRNQAWRLSGYKEADFSDGVTTEAVRSVLSYENTKLAMTDLEDLSGFHESLRMQVYSYLLERGLSGLHMDS